MAKEPAMRLQNLSTWMLSFALFMPLAACDEEDDGGDDSAGDTADGTEGSGNNSGNSGNGMTSSSSETCMSSHDCINGSCVCQTPGLEDMPCTDDDACAEECEICE
jgi:hypothetical protein